MTMTILDNIVWHTLSGPHAVYSLGDHRVRRYARGFPPVVAFADPATPDFHVLERYVAPGERVYCDGWSGRAPAGWQVTSENILLTMLHENPVALPASSYDAVLLECRSALAALELADLTRPGPFTLRTLELGEYFGIFEGARLIAMAGSKRCAGGFSEVTGVCTHPDFTGRGLARRLVGKVLRNLHRRGERPFLRVMQDSQGAVRLYHRLGFRPVRASLARTLVQR